MPSLARVRAVWTGTTGLPGVSTFYIEDPVDTSFIADIRAAFAACADLFPAAVSIQVENSGDSVDAATGILDGSWSGASVLPVTGLAGVATHAAGVGARVRWLTGGIVGRRRVQGRTFLAPISTFNYQADGTLTIDAIADCGAFGAAMSSVDGLAIWSRPSSGGSDGSSHLVTSFSVPDQVSSLRSRRN